MPNIHLSDNAKRNLDILAEHEKRPLTSEVDFLVAERMKQLGLNYVESEPKETPSVA